MKKSFKIVLHIGFWLGYFILVAIVMFAATRSEEMNADLRRYYTSFILGVAIIPPMLSFYSHYFYLFPNFLQKRKLTASIVLSLLIAVTAALAGFFVVQMISQKALVCIQGGFPYAISFTSFLGLVFGGIALVIKGFFTWFKELKLKEELLEKNHQMELALVKSQLDPHFLFNTINNIDVLIEKEPTEASHYLKKLSDMMRFMLYQTKDEQILLSEELGYIEKYIELQKIRTGNRNFVNYEILGTPNGQMVAPMLFIPFIENAFKHTNNKKIDNAVDIDVKIEGHHIIFKCQNKFDPDKPSENGQNGLGNELIQKRLDVLYPGRHSLRVERSKDEYSVELSIQDGKV